MRKSTEAYFSVEQLTQLAASKYVEAAIASNESRKQQLLAEADSLATRAKVKSLVEHVVAPEKFDAYH